MKKQFVKSKSVAKVTFNPSAEVINGGKEVIVLGDFNNWDPELGFGLKKQKDGSFKGVLELDKGQEYQFKYLVDGNSWVNDTEADSLVPSPFGEPNSVVSTIE
ncbi:MAG: isoamylase early set domain-containing protein [Saprospiraceae bacterium]|jgi:1,4-alpha-glucan branching enzyme|nr:isoamylase early set domain-containing protein [Saprospiraceae bacterium]